MLYTGDMPKLRWRYHDILKGLLSLNSQMKLKPIEEEQKRMVKSFTSEELIL